MARTVLPPEHEPVTDDYIIERDDELPRTPIGTQIARVLRFLLVLVLAAVSLALFWLVSTMIRAVLGLTLTLPSLRDGPLPLPQCGRGLVSSLSRTVGRVPEGRVRASEGGYTTRMFLNCQGSSRSRSSGKRRSRSWRRRVAPHADRVAEIGPGDFEDAGEVHFVGFDDAAPRGSRPPRWSRRGPRRLPAARSALLCGATRRDSSIDRREPYQ